MEESTEVIKALRISDINVNNITISHIKKNKIVPIMYQQKKSLIFQTPFLEISDAVTKTKHQDIKQFITNSSGDTKRRLSDFFHFIEEIETRITDQVIKTEDKWFTQKEVLLTTLVRVNENGDPYIKWPFDINSSIFIDEKKQPFNFEDIKKKDRVKIIVELSNLWIDKNQFGLAVNIQKVLVKQHQEKIQSEYIFDEESDSDVENDEQSNKIISLFATEQKPQQTSSKISKLQKSNYISQETEPKKFERPLVNNEKKDTNKSAMGSAKGYVDKNIKVPNDKNIKPHIDKNAKKHSTEQSKYNEKTVIELVGHDKKNAKTNKDRNAFHKQQISTSSDTSLCTEDFIQCGQKDNNGSVAFSDGYDVIDSDSD